MNFIPFFLLANNKTVKMLIVINVLIPRKLAVEIRISLKTILESFRFYLVKQLIYENQLKDFRHNRKPKVIHFNTKVNTSKYTNTKDSTPFTRNYPVVVLHEYVGVFYYFRLFENTRVVGINCFRILPCLVLLPVYRWHQ